MSEQKTGFDKVLDVLKESKSKAEEFLQGASKTVTEKVSFEKKKIDLKSSIGEQSKAIDSAFYQLGQAYYQNQLDGTPIENTTELMDAIKVAKEKVESLTNELNNLTGKSE